MNIERYDELCNELTKLELETERKKRKSYTAGNKNVLHNFESDSEFVGTSALQNVLTHMMKQVRAISSFVKNPDIEPSETLASRCADLRVYCKLILAVAEDSGRDHGLTKSVTPEAAEPPQEVSYLKWGTGPFDYSFGGNVQ